MRVLKLQNAFESYIEASEYFQQHLVDTQANGQEVTQLHWVIKDIFDFAQLGALFSAINQSQYLEVLNITVGKGVELENTKNTSALSHLPMYSLSVSPLENISLHTINLILPEDIAEDSLYILVQWLLRLPNLTNFNCRYSWETLNVFEIAINNFSVTNYTLKNHRLNKADEAKVQQIARANFCYQKAKNMMEQLSAIAQGQSGEELEKNNSYKQCEKDAIHCLEEILELANNIGGNKGKLLTIHAYLLMNTEEGLQTAAKIYKEALSEVVDELTENLEFMPDAFRFNIFINHWAILSELRFADLIEIVIRYNRTIALYQSEYSLDKLYELVIQRLLADAPRYSDRKEYLATILAVYLSMNEQSKFETNIQLLLSELMDIPGMSAITLKELATAHPEKYQIAMLQVSKYSQQYQLLKSKRYELSSLELQSRLAIADPLLTEVEICNSKGKSNAQSKDLIEQLMKNPHVQSLTLDSNVIHDKENIRNFCQQYLAHTQTLRKLDWKLQLSNPARPDTYDDEIGSVLFDALSTNKSLQELTIHEFMLPDSSSTSLGLESNTTLKKLTLVKPYFGEQGFGTVRTNFRRFETFVSGIAENQGLETLCFRSYAMSNKEVKLLCKAMQHNKVIRSLILHIHYTGNTYNNDNFSPLGQMLQINKSLRALQLPYVNNISKEEFLKLADGLTVNSNLEFLELNITDSHDSSKVVPPDLNEDSLIAFFERLQQNKSLRKLNFKGNIIFDVRASKALVNFVRQHERLEEFDFTRENIDPAYLAQLDEALAQKQISKQASEKEKTALIVSAESSKNATPVNIRYESIYNLSGNNDAAIRSMVSPDIDISTSLQNITNRFSKARVHEFFRERAHNLAIQIQQITNFDELKDTFQRILQTERHVLQFEFGIYGKVGAEGRTKRWQLIARTLIKKAFELATQEALTNQTINIDHHKVYQAISALKTNRSPFDFGIRAMPYENLFGLCQVRQGLNEVMVSFQDNKLFNMKFKLEEIYTQYYKEISALQIILSPQIAINYLLNFANFIQDFLTKIPESSSSSADNKFSKRLDKNILAFQQKILKLGGKPHAQVPQSQFTTCKVVDHLDQHIADLAKQMARGASVNMENDSEKSFSPGL